MNQPTHPELLDAFPASTVDKFGALITHSIAVRGDRHMLITWKFAQEGGFHTGGLSVIEADESHLFTAIISFDEDDLASAVAELESRYRALAGNAYTVANVVLAVWADDPRYSVVVLDDHGRAASCEFFDEHQWNAALVRFDELTTP